MDVETPSGGRDRTVRLIRAFAPKKNRTFHQRHSGRTRPRGNDPFPVKRLPWKAQDVPIFTMMSSSFMDTFGSLTGQLARVA
jgi:hypothetical protein